MVNYGYDCKDWPVEAKRELAKELEKLIDVRLDANGRQAEIELDGTYPGVRIRKLTWFKPQEIDDIVNQADGIHARLEAELKGADE